MPEVKYQPTELLTKSHDSKSFDCGEEELDKYLKRFALNNQKKDIARTYVTVKDDRVVGYYTLTYGSVSHEDATPEIKAGLLRYPIPIILLARLAVDSREKGNGLGKELLKDAMLRSIQAADIAGLRAFLVHAKHAEARSYYEQFGFEPSPTSSLHLFLSIKDIRANLA